MGAETALIIAIGAGLCACCGGGLIWRMRMLRKLEEETEEAVEESVENEAIAGNALSDWNEVQKEEPYETLTEQ